MRYLVISPCEDSRSGKEFETGHEFLPEPDAEQAERLVKAGCLRKMPDDAPQLPGTGATDATIASLKEDVARLLEANTDLRNQLTTAQSDLADARTDAGKLSNERDDLRGQLDAANSRVADLEKSVTQEQNPSSTEKPTAKAKASA